MSSLERWSCRRSAPPKSRGSSSHSLWRLKTRLKSRTHPTTAQMPSVQPQKTKPAMEVETRTFHPGPTVQAHPKPPIAVVMKAGIKTTRRYSGSKIPEEATVAESFRSQRALAENSKCQNRAAPPAC